MTARQKLAIAGVMTALAASPFPASAAGSPLGVWIDHTGRGAVEITQCGSRLCGKLVWLKDSRKQKACGTQIIGGVGKVGRSWDGGWIYNPEERKKFDVELTPSGRNRLVVLGYMGTKLFSKEMIWTRAPANLDRCDMIEAKAKPDKQEAVAKKAVAEAPKDLPKPVRNPKLAKAEISEPVVADPKPEPPKAAEKPAPAPQPVEAKQAVKDAATDPIEQVPVKKIEPKPELAERDVEDQPEDTQQARAAPQPRPAKRPDITPKDEADAWASEPGQTGRTTRTAEAKVEVDVSDDVYVRVPDRSRGKSRKMCRVDAPFVTVEFPCDD